MLRWHVAESPSLSPEMRGRFIAQNRHRITTDGQFVISSQRYRDQPRNIADCREKLQALLRAAAVRPAPAEEDETDRRLPPSSRGRQAAPLSREAAEVQDER